MARPACIAKAEATTRSLIARRFDESAKAMARITTIPIRPIHRSDIKPAPARLSPDHAASGAFYGAIQALDRIVDIVGDKQLVTAGDRQ